MFNVLTKVYPELKFQRNTKTKTKLISAALYRMFLPKTICAEVYVKFSQTNIYLFDFEEMQALELKCRIKKKIFHFCKLKTNNIILILNFRNIS